MKKLLSWLLILLPVLWVFRQIFFGNLPTWGDAPFFYPEGLKELFNEPLTWTARNISFGGVNSMLWISPIMFLMGVLNKVLILGSDATVKILFYFPSIIFCIVGPYFLCRYLKVSKTVSFFSTLTYPLSTYYLLLVDGGQIGVVLAYGLFPLIILFGKRMFDKTTVLTFFLFLLSSFILTVADPRIVFIAYLTLFIWQLFEDWKKLLFLIISGILLIGKDNNDLTMSFLQKYFVSSSENISSQWAVYGKDQYLNAKYELLIRDYSYDDLDYGRGIAFSTKNGEVIKFKFKVPENGKYMLATRLGTFDKQNFSWELEEKVLTKGSFEYVYENKSGFEVLNAVALIPIKDFETAQRQADIFVKHFGVISKKDIINQVWKEVNLNTEGTLKYKLQEKQEGYWIILSQNFNSLWNFKKGIEYFKSVPVYSMVNGFYVEPDWGDLHIEFRGQEYFRWGLWVSAISILGLSIIFLFFIERNNERKNIENNKN